MKYHSLEKKKKKFKSIMLSIIFNRFLRRAGCPQRFNVIKVDLRITSTYGTRATNTLQLFYSQARKTNASGLAVDS